MVDDLSNSYNGQNSAALAVLALIDMDGLSYEDYFKKVEEMIENLRQYWKSEQRVKALKVAIQLTKLLADTNQIRLYSKKYKMITDILDEFGRLVYIRIQSRANGIDTDHQQQPHQQSSNNNYLNSTYSLSQSNANPTSALENLERAKDTCRNWFLKIASIRELVPRFYTELAVLKVRDILLQNQSNKITGLTEEQFYCQSVKRLTNAAWGFGDPIIAIHARSYLCKVAQRLIPWNFNKNHESTMFDILMLNLEASAKLVNQLDFYSLQKMLQYQKLDSMIYFDLISSQLQAIINLVTLRDDIYNDTDNLNDQIRDKLEVMFKCLMSYAKQTEASVFSRNILLNSTLRALPNDIVACHAQDVLEVILETHQNWKDLDTMQSYSKIIVSSLHATITSFALALDGSDEFESDVSSSSKNHILDSVLNILESLFEYEQNLSPQISTNYLRSFEVWLSYANHYLNNSTQVDELLVKFVSRVKEDRQYIHQHSIIISLIKILISSRKSLDGFREVVTMKSFQQLLTLLSRDDHKLEASRWIMETIRANLKINKQEPATILDRTVINFILKLSSAINDSLSLLTPNDDVEHLSQLVIYFLDRISVQDFKEHLDLFSKCRGTLGNLNPVLEYLARRTLELALEYRKVERKRNAKRNYLNGCLAFTFITIPAIRKPLIRLNLFIEGARLALSQTSLSLADYYIKQALINLDSQLEVLVGDDQKCKTKGGTLTMDTIGELSSTPLKVSKPLLDLVHILMGLMLSYEDYIDLKHKLLFANIIRNTSLSEELNLLNDLMLLNIIDDYNVTNT